MKVYMNEAALDLPAVRALVDHSTHHFEVTLENGTTLRLLVVRRVLEPGASLAERVGALMGEKARELRGFRVLGLTTRSHPTVNGIEVKVRYRDGERGMVYQHQLHTALRWGEDVTWLAFHGEAALEHAELCDQWMTRVLEDLVMRDG
jgi:hypothetical protein